MEQYSSVVWFIFEMHSGNGSGNLTFSDAFGRSLFAKRQIQHALQKISSHWAIYFQISSVWLSQFFW